MRIRLFRLLPLVAVLILPLAACTTIDPVSAAKLATLSPIEADPATLRVVIKMPVALELRSGNAFVAMAWSSATKAPVRKTFALDLEESQRLTAGPSARLEAGQKFVVLSLADGDVARFRDFQREIRADRAAGGNGKGSLTVGFTGRCWRGVYPDGRGLSFDIWLQTAPDADYLPLVRGGDLGRMLVRGGAPTMPSCP